MAVLTEYQLPILMYHRVVKSKSEAGKHNIYVTEKDLRSSFDYLKRKGIQTITFRDLHRDQSSSDLKNKIILTFDDGYEDNHRLLFPLLKEYGFTAVIFLVTRKDKNYWGMAEGEPALHLMTQEQIKEMDEYGVEFGGHTQNHVDLSGCSLEVQRQEIAGSKEDVESIIKKPVISFAYPFGGINEQAKRVVEESGYKYAVATKTGPYNWKEDLYRIRRIEISSRTTLIGFKRKVSGYYFNKASILHYFKFN
jgi:peptidoglycan/xylan/chitin deacetylase (PgdA/CDA1 family)